MSQHDETETSTTTTRRRSHLAAEWKLFQRALMRSPDPFNPFVWIYRLVGAAARDVVERTPGLSQWRHLVPAFALLLIFSVAAAYFGKLRSELVRERWCGHSSDNNNNDEDSASQGTESILAAECGWMKLHDFLATYFLLMVLFHFVRTMYLSPGFSVVSDGHHALKQLETSSCFDTVAERERTQLFYRLPPDRPSIENHKDDKAEYFPDPNPSFCKKCQAERPPRCHHCSVCRRCVLQFDHHCLWLNNCVGYGNHRSFVLTLSFIALSCWYGVLLFYRPFYEPLQEQLREHGGIIKYVQLYAANKLPEYDENEKGLFDIPTVAEIGDMILCPDKSMPVQAVVDLLFPLLFGVGAILALFLGMHIKYILKARTTLEHRFLLDEEYESLLSGLSEHKNSKGASKTGISSINPYDQGYYRNWTRIMGSNWFYLLLPLPVHPPLPYIPYVSRKKEQ